MSEEEIIERAKDLYPKLLPLSTYICGYAFHDNDGTPKEIIQKYLAIGAEWQKEQMMKDAVKAEVYKFGEIVYVKECSNAELAKHLSQFNNGDKVKIIAIHETDIR